MITKQQVAELVARTFWRNYADDERFRPGAVDRIIKAIHPQNLHSEDAFIKNVSDAFQQERDGIDAGTPLKISLEEFEQTKPDGRIHPSRTN